MRIKTLLLASLLVAAGSSAFATPGTSSFSNNVAYFQNPVPLSGSFSDAISLTGLSPGTYDFSFSLSGQYLSGIAITVGGSPVSSANIDYLGPGNKYVFAFTDVTTNALPLMVDISGTAATNGLANYSGQVTAVPEPESYGLALAGLCGVVVMRRRQQAKT
jgi:hypothetical protein